jgi:hypothetical protein
VTVSGIVLSIIGVLVLVQVTKGQALQRLGVLS